MVTKSPKAVSKPPAPAPGFLESWFGIARRGSTIGREVRGGLVTLFTMVYIVALNPLIIGTTADKNGNLVSGLPLKDAAGAVIQGNVDTTKIMVAAATALIAGLMTILMGVVGRFPIGLATGLGLNAVLAYVIAPRITWPQAMGLVVWEGILITILVLTGFRQMVFRAVPPHLRTGISVGIGLFIALVGLVDAGFVRKASGTPLELGVGGSLIGWPIAVFVVGLLLLIVLYVKRVKGAILIAVISGSVLAVILQAVLNLPGQASDKLGWSLAIPSVPHLSDFTAPNLGLLGRVDMIGGFTGGPTVVLGLLLLVFSLMLADFFDTMGTVVAVGAEGNLLDAQGNPPRVGEILLVDSLAAAAGGLGSVSSNTSYIESAAGVGEGARTGLASVVTGVGFILALFLSPLVSMVPSEAAAPALVFVGFLMMSAVKDVDWEDPEIGIPTFATIILMPFAYSITAGIGAGFLLHVFIKLVRGKAKEVHWLLYVIAALFLIYFGQGLLLSLLPTS
jgi:AGZA family xanthine/uracil permease-like MFS transporter